VAGRGEKLMRDVKTKLVKLGIALDYPVRWGFEKVLRDLIQNFYDSIGYESFGKDFHYSYDPMDDTNYQITMSTENRTFNFEWLTYLGASTKTGKRNYIGKYGEGFKICMLSLMKMGITDISMHSGGWTINPCSYMENIDGVNVSMLAYEYREVPEDESTSLIIRGVNRKNVSYMEEALLHFFYPANPLFGEKIGQGEKYIIFESNGKSIPTTQPDRFRGIFYVNYLARGRLPVPFFVMVTGGRIEDRDSRKREVLNQFDVWQGMYMLTRMMSPDDSLKLLIRLRDKWNDLPESIYDIETYYYVICQLVRNVSLSVRTSEQFRTQYNNLVYIDRYGSDRKMNSRIRQAWIRARGRESGIMVNPVFRLLGAESLLDQFNQENENLRIPEPTEKEMIYLLYYIYKEVIPVFWQVELPEIWIGTEKDAEKDPLAYGDQSFWTQKRIKHQKYRLHKLVMCEKDFGKDSYDDTLVTFIDKMLHIFGSSRSNRMNVLFTELGAYLIRQKNVVIEGRKAWNRIYQEKMLKE